MLLLFDIGNTCTKVGALLNGVVALLASVENENPPHIIKDTLAAYKGAECFIVSVNPAKTPEWTDYLEGEGHRITLFKKDMATAFKTKYKNPNALGDDRVVTSYGAYKLYGGGLIVIDLGTAAKFCLVDYSGVHLGGAILPGKKAYQNALSGKTAVLPAVDMKKAPNMVGITTIENLESGLYYGFIGSVDYMINKLKSEPRFTDYKVILTGGDTDLFLGNPNIDILDKALTLKGLGYIYSHHLSFKA